MLSHIGSNTGRQLTVCVILSWPVIPGRGEFVRLAFEYTSTPYKENLDPKSIEKVCNSGNPSHFAVPVLQIDDAFLSQTPAILSYLAPRLGLDGTGDSKGVDADLRRAQTIQVLLTVLDLSNEMHDVHHPIGASLYYEDQKQEALKRSDDTRANRLPKFYGYFEKLLKENKGRLVAAGQVTTADLALWQVLCGVEFALPRWVRSAREQGKFKDVWRFQEEIGQLKTIKSYVDSDRRKPFS